VKSILDPSFRYVPSLKTDLRKTFERIRLEAAKNAAKPIQPPLADKSGSRDRL
jgi:hypothetical protein